MIVPADMRAFEVIAHDGPVMSCAIHAGHEMRRSLLARCLLDEASRLREEDPYTDHIARVNAGFVRALRSRFEVDLNRPREGAVYRTPDEAWGLELWRGDLPDMESEASLAVYDAFYGRMESLLEDSVAAHGGAVVFDVHSYNHRRGGPDAPPDDPEGSPEVNLGTGTLDLDRWGGLVARVLAHLGGTGFDARENVRFRGGHFSAWAHDRFAGDVCVLAFEFKKVFMDEWTGEADASAIERARRALQGCVPLAEAATSERR